LGCFSLSTVVFQSDSRLSCIGRRAFFGCRSLLSICIPWSLTKLGYGCFCHCWSLSPVTFESGSQLSRVKAFVFRECHTLRSIWIPSRLQDILSKYRPYLNVVETKPTNAGDTGYDQGAPDPETYRTTEQ
jgi:hypothetical protein